MKSVFSKKPLPDPELLSLQAELRSAQLELACAYRQFNQAVDPELVESCVYQISAVKARCNYLIRAIKEHTPDALSAAASAPGRKSVRRAARTWNSGRAAAFLPVADAAEHIPCEADGEGAAWI